MTGGRRTKIVATIGPASSSVRVLTRMINAGMGVARLNFSHGTHPQHKSLIRHIRSASHKTGKEVAILQDLQGPKIRVGELPEGGIELKRGEKVVFRTGVDGYEHDEIPVTYDQFHKDVKKDHRIYLNDGRLEAIVQSVRGRRVHAKVKTGGTLTSHKGINIPDSNVSTPSFTKKDHEDLLFGLEQGVDWVALSFVTSEEVVLKVRKIIRAKCRSLGSVMPKIIVKIERREAVDGFLEILNAADGIMLARGDLGIEIPPEEVPIIQKEFVEICRQAGKPAVVATHMLDSMTDSPRATRAEISDVANAVIDHADGVMLSAESATGEYPDLAVRTMADVIDETEASRLDDINFYQWHNIPDVSTSIAQNLHVMAENGQIDMIVSSATFPLSSSLNIFRPNVPIVMACPNKAVARQMMLRAGVYGMVLKDDPATFINRAQNVLRKRKLISKTDRVAYILATPSGEIQLTVR